MADDTIFTSEQELTIINSPEFEDFLKKQRAAGSDRIGIEDFLNIAGNREKWAKRFQDEAKKSNRGFMG